MNAADLTFGVEIECTVPANVTIMMGGYHRGIQVPQLPVGWTAQYDGSIQAGRGRQGVEIVSPILKGEDGLRQMLFVLGWLRSIGAKVNTTCGFHVHVGFNAQQTTELGRVVSLVARHEKGLYAVTGTKSREEGNFCRPIKDAVDYASFKAGERRPRLPYTRYFTLNLANLAYGTKPTVEFRVFGSTLNDVKATGYVRLALAIVEKALKTNRTVAWDLVKNAGEARKFPNQGEGRYNTMKLIYGLGWKRGEQPVEYGSLGGDGIPTTEDIVKELYRLADKYDGRQPETQD